MPKGPRLPEAVASVAVVHMQDVVSWVTVTGPRPVLAMVNRCITLPADIEMSPKSWNGAMDARAPAAAGSFAPGRESGDSASGPREL